MNVDRCRARVAAVAGPRGTDTGRKRGAQDLCRRRAAGESQEKSGRSENGMRFHAHLQTVVSLSVAMADRVHKCVHVTRSLTKWFKLRGSPTVDPVILVPVLFTLP